MPSICTREFRLGRDLQRLEVLTTAILDRLLHHATIIKIKDDGCRFRGKKAAS